MMNGKYAYGDVVFSSKKLADLREYFGENDPDDTTAARKLDCLEMVLTCDEETNRVVLAPLQIEANSLDDNCYIIYGEQAYERDTEESGLVFVPSLHLDKSGIAILARTQAAALAGIPNYILML